MLLRKMDIAIVFTGRNEVVAKVMFLQVSVIHSVHRGGSPENPPPRQGDPPTPTPRQGEPPWDQGDPPRTRENPPGPGRPPRDQGDTPTGSRLQHTVYERPVRILLECILVNGGLGSLLWCEYSLTSWGMLLKLSQMS